MSESRKFFSGSYSAATNFYGKVQNFSLDSVIIYIKKASTAITESDLEKITVNGSLKNSKGDNVILINNIPLSLLADYSDYKGGWSANSVDNSGAIKLDLGNIILEGNDEVNLSFSCATPGEATTLYVFGYDSFIGPEQIITYDHVIAQATQHYTFNDVIDVFAKIASPSESAMIAVDDFYGRNQIAETEVVALGAAQGRAENFDNFGVVFHDETGLTQSVGITTGSANERLLVQKRFFDETRIGNAQKSYIDAAALLNHIKQNNSNKYRCLMALFG